MAISYTISLIYSLQVELKWAIYCLLLLFAALINDAKFHNSICKRRILSKTSLVISQWL